MTELIVDLLISRAIQVQMFFHYFLVYFCIYILHEDTRVGRLALYYSLILLIQLLGGSPDYFFHEAVLHEIISIQVTLLAISGRRAVLLVGLSTFGIVINILMYEFVNQVGFFYTHYEIINRVMLETTMAILLYDHKSKWRNLILILIMLLIYTHEL